jgi:hypothetical protein
MLGFGEVSRDCFLRIGSGNWEVEDSRSCNVKALLRSADAELRRAYFAGVGLALCWASAKYGLPYEAPSLRGGEVWAGLDSNQRRREPADLQSAPFGRFGTYP